MKKLFYLPLFILVLHTQLIGQCSQPQAINYLHGNNVRAAFLNGGDMFWDGTQSAQYQVPYTPGGTTLNTIFASALWLSAVDPSANVLVSTQTYRTNGTDYWSGPLDPATGQANDCQAFDQIWKVTGADVQAFLADFNDNGVLDNPVPSSILQWPARNNSHSTVIMNSSNPSADLAPFFDKNNDNTYNPYDGDYPIADPAHSAVIADDLLWMVFNDNGNIHTHSSVQGLKTEIHLTAYAFSCSNDPIINSTIFTRHKIINRNTLTLTDWSAGLWVDFDLGCHHDDYIGTAPNLNTMYVYNEDNDDNVVCGSTNGYGTNPPVQAITMLNQSLDNSIYMVNSPSSPTGDPVSAMNYHRLLNGSWGNGTPLSSGGSGYNPVNSSTAAHMFPDNPNDPNGWSMHTEGLNGLDTRALGATHQATVLPGQSIEIVTAYSYHRDMNKSNLENVDLMYQQVPMIQSFYNNGYSNNNCSFATSVQQISAANNWIEVYPNPTKDILTINSKQTPITAIEIINPLGQSILQKSNLNEQALQLSLKDLSQGFYILKVNSENDTWSQKIQLTK